MKKPRILVNVEAIRDLPGLTVNDVYGRYPDGKINVARAQQLLLDHDLFVFQHPSPALFKDAPPSFGKSSPITIWRKRIGIGPVLPS